MSEQSSGQAGEGLKVWFRRGSSALTRLWVRRDEDLFGQVTWEFRDGALVITMVTAALAGFGVATAMTGGTLPWQHPPVAPVADEEAAVKPQHMLKIQVRSELPRPEPAPSPMAAPVPLVPVSIEPLTAPPARAQPAPQVAPVRLAARAAAIVSVPIAAPRAQPESRRTDEDMELALADRELAIAYREAGQAGAPAAALRADQQAWRTIRAAAAGRSREALLNAYRDHIDDLRDAAEDAQAERQPRYAESPAYSQQGYGQPYGGYPPRY